jgi:hypothetical protein
MLAVQGARFGQEADEYELSAEVSASADSRLSAWLAQPLRSRHALFTAQPRWLRRRTGRTILTVKGKVIAPTQDRAFSTLLFVPQFPRENVSCQETM